MPALLIDAYGSIFAQEMQTTRLNLNPKKKTKQKSASIFAQEMQTTRLNLNPKKKTKQKSESALGAVASSDDDIVDDSATPPRPRIPTAKPVVRTRPTWGEKDGNYEIHITIDRNDCHLLCLFIGVFTLSVLFNSNKKGSSSTSG